jgi:hypothetical protein
MKKIIATIISLITISITSISIAQDSEVDSLKNRIEKLERLMKLQGRGSDKDTIQFQKSPLATAIGGQPQQFPAYNQRTTATGFSRFFNPAISTNGIYLGTYNSEQNGNSDAETKTGFKIQEQELIFTAMVDNYLRANLMVAFEDDEVEIEESYVDALLTAGLSLRAGKWFQTFGKHNFLHTHQFPFVDKPLVNEEIFGEEALNEVGFGLNYLAPTPWYTEFVFNVLEGANDSLFNGPLNDDFAYLFHLKNLWDINEETTVELGGSYSFGRNSIGSPNGDTQIVGGNFTVKWVPSQRARYNQVEWQTEYISSSKETGVTGAVDNPDEDKAGIYSYLKYQFAQNWWAQARYGFFGLDKPAGTNDKDRITGMLAYTPTEFSAIRFQYNYLDEDNIQAEHQLFLQLNYTMGSHPAHFY